MIIDAIVGILMAILQGFLALLPSWDFEGISDFGPALGDSLAAASTVFPVATLGLCLAATLAVWLFINGWQLIVYIWRLIPFKAT